jgi:hypothetical protein
MLPHACVCFFVSVLVSMHIYAGWYICVCWHAFICDCVCVCVHLLYYFIFKVATQSPFLWKLHAFYWICACTLKLRRPLMDECACRELGAPRGTRDLDYDPDRDSDGG